MEIQNNEKIATWRLLLDEQAKSGLTIREFCKNKNITSSQYYYYRQMIFGKKSRKNDRAKVVIKPIQLINQPNRDNQSIRFVLPNSIQCVLPLGISPQEIKSILEVLLSC